MCEMCIRDRSTIIKSIAGLLRYQGMIKIQGNPAKTLEAKKQFAYVPEIPAMFDALTVREHIEYMRRAYTVSYTHLDVYKRQVRQCESKRDGKRRNL